MINFLFNKVQSQNSRNRQLRIRNGQLRIYESRVLHTVKSSAHKRVDSFGPIWDDMLRAYAYFMKLHAPAGRAHGFNHLRMRTRTIHNVVIRTYIPRGHNAQLGYDMGRVSARKRHCIRMSKASKCVF